MWTSNPRHRICYSQRNCAWNSKDENIRPVTYLGMLSKLRGYAKSSKKQQCLCIWLLIVYIFNFKRKACHHLKAETHRDCIPQFSSYFANSKFHFLYSQLMSHKGLISADRENPTKAMNTLWAKCRIVNVTARDTYRYMPLDMKC
jgi:hypothetical protein